MNAARMREILKTEFGIGSETEFEEAVRRFEGIDLGIFTSPLSRRSISDEQKKKTQNPA